MDINHGGQVYRAARDFNRPVEDWLDLSTGISPWAWPVPEVPKDVWQRLPDDDGELERQAARYYGAHESAVLAVPGSQYALQTVPQVIAQGRVAVPQRGYAEHHSALRAAGHELVHYASEASLEALVSESRVDHVLIINPNNPTAQTWSSSSLRAIHRDLHRRRGCLLLDEAFADITVGQSLAAECPTPGLIVYRSLGKFFGLAGLRLGFLLADEGVLEAVRDRMGPWMVSSPARWVGAHALADTRWHVQQRERILSSSAVWFSTLQSEFPRLELANGRLFVTGIGEIEYCRALYCALGKRGLLTRLFEPIDGKGMLRFGLPRQSDMERAHNAIAIAAGECPC